MDELRDKIENLLCAQDEYARLLVEASVNGATVKGYIYIMLSDAKDRLMEEMRMMSGNGELRVES